MELEDVRFRESDFDVHGFVERVARWSATRASASHHGQPEPETDNASWLVEPAEETKGKEEDENDDEEAASAKARKSISAAGGGEADRMLKAFKDTSAELWVLHDQVEKELSSLEVSCRSQEERHLEALKSSQFLENGFGHLRQLGHDLTSVESKILTIKLEGVKARRDRLMEATNLVKHFTAFTRAETRLLPPLHKFEGLAAGVDDDEIDPDAVTDPDAEVAAGETSEAELELAASVMQRLLSLVSELPQNQYTSARARIAKVHEAVESKLLVNFRASLLTDKAKIIEKSINRINMFSARLFNQAVRIFVEQFVERKFNNLASDVFQAVNETCAKAAYVIHRAFPSPEAVVQTFVTSIFRTGLKDYVDTQLTDNPDSALELLHELFLRTQTLVKELNESLQLGMDGTTQLKFIRGIYTSHLDVYIERELSSLTLSYERLLHDFYDEVSPAMEKSPTGSKFRPGHRRSKSVEVQIVPSNGLLREDLAIQMLDDNRRAIERCRTLAPAGKSPEWAFRLFTQLLEGLCTEHIGYALACAVKALPPRKPKTAPDIGFFGVIKEANSLFYLLQKHFQETVTPAVRESLSLYPACLDRKNNVMQQLEKQLAGGLNHALDSIEEWVKHVLSREQVKSDFKPDEMGMLSASCSVACAKVNSFLKAQIAIIKESLNGKNLISVLRDLGTRVHRVLLEHIRSYQFSDLGGIQLTCDLNEYDKAFSLFSDTFVSELMETLKELARLLVVRADSVPQLISEGRLALMDKAVVQSFLSIRADYKSAKLNTVFK